VAKPTDLLSVEDARARVLDQFHLLDSEVVSLGESAGRILASAVHAGMDVPPFANSSMDGFAVRSGDTRSASGEAPVTLAVTGAISAGSRSAIEIHEGECARIMTGAPVPSGADAVIPFEDVSDRGDSIQVSHEVAPNDCIRPAGNDVRSGSEVLEQHVELGARQVGLLGALGYSEVSVVRRPVIAILATGDELVSPGLPISLGQIYNSNSAMLAAAVSEAGGIARPVDSVRDDPDAIRAALTSAHGCHLLITTGGASVGDYDYMTDVVGTSGHLSFWRVRVRPGKPLLFGSFGGTPIIGLPGNPTSALVTFELFVRPAIRQMLGASTTRPTVRVIVDEKLDNRGGRRTFFRVLLRKQGDRMHARVAGSQDSAMLLPLARADALVEVSEDCDEVSPGAEATAHIWRLPA
jgi:molybdopterin molybdotransferase